MEVRVEARAELQRFITASAYLKSAAAVAER